MRAGGVLREDAPVRKQGLEANFSQFSEHEHQSKNHFPHTGQFALGVRDTFQRNWVRGELCGHLPFLLRVSNIGVETQPLHEKWLCQPAAPSSSQRREAEAKAVWLSSQRREAEAEAACLKFYIGIPEP